MEPNPRKVKNFLNSLCANWSLLKGERLSSKEMARRFIMFQYLRLHHRPVWRILERQPKALGLLSLTLSTKGGPVALEASPMGQEPDSEQRVMRKVFEYSFSHVLPHTSTSVEDDQRHGYQDLEKVVEQFIERIDRKRSDDYFAQWIARAIPPDEALDPIFLSLQG